MVEAELYKFGARDTWFFDLGTSCHFCNNQKLFSNLKAIIINFVTFAKEVIYIKKIGIVFILLANGHNIELHIIALAVRCNLHLILLC